MPIIVRLGLRPDPLIHGAEQGGELGGGDVGERGQGERRQAAGQDDLDGQLPGPHDIIAELVVEGPVREPMLEVPRHRRAVGPRAQEQGDALHGEPLR